MNPVLKRIFPHAIAIIGFLLVCVIYFLPQLQGKVAQSSDNIQYKGMAQELNKYKQDTGETALWTNSMFGGMPSYQINTAKEGNYISVLDKIATLGFSRPIGYFLAGMIGFYILMICLGVNPWLSMIGAIAFGFTTNNFLLFEAGHYTKLRAVSYIPLIAAGVLMAFRKNYIWGAVLFGAGLALNLYANHVQMTYYLFLTLIIWGIAQLVKDAKAGHLPEFFKAVGVLAIAGVLALGSSAVNLYVTYEYSNDTMRGKPILEKTAAAPAPGGIQSSSETQGLSWDYAMGWSNGTLDVVAAFIPGVVGGGSQEPFGKSAALAKDSQWRQVLRGGNTFPLYWGSLPFTSGPIYFGAIIVFLFFMGLTLVKGPIKWWIAIGTLLTVLLSMGKNMEIINRLFFDYFPLFNKFRTPNSVLSVTAFLMPVLSILALSNIVQKKVTTEEVMKSLKISGGILGAICLFFILMGPSFFDFSSLGDARYEQAGLNIDPLIETRQANMRSDAIRSLVLMLLAGGLIWAYIQGKIKEIVLFAGIGLLVTFDLWGVGKRYLTNDDFKTKKGNTALFTPRAVDKQILADKDLHYRVYDLSEGSPFINSKTSYFHRSLGGYHAAKLQRYDDIITRHLTKGTQSVINMLNTKYIIQGEGQQAQAQQNPAALGNAWFVDELISVNTANEEIDRLTNLQAGTQAVVHQEFSDYIAGFNGKKEGTITLTEYKPHELTYQSQTSAETFAVFSEVWYGPNKGWNAYIDGTLVEHIRVNYLLRGLRIPAGSHKIEFKFEPTAYNTGMTVSMVSSSLLVLGLLGFAGFKGYQQIQEIPNQAPPKPAERSPRKPAAKPSAQRGRKRKK